MNANPVEKVQQPPCSRVRIPEWICPGQWLPWLLLVMGLLVTCLIWWHERQIAALELKANFEFRVRRDIALIKQRMTAYEQVMRGVQGLFAASRTVDRKQFRIYVSTLQLETNYPGIQGVSFALKVPQKQKGAHTAAIRAEGFPGYGIRPEGLRDNYVPVIYLEPFSSSNQRVFGYDTYSEPTRRTTMDLACDTGMPALSGKIRLVQENGKRPQAGVLMFLPVYKYGLPHDTPDSRRSNVIGWLAASFRVDDLMAGLYGERRDEVDIEIYDGTELSDNSLLHDSDGIRFAGIQAVPLKSLTSIQIAGHTWTVAIRTLPGFETRLASKKPQFVLMAGTVLSLLLTLLTWQLATSRSRALKVAREMTQELEELNRSLESRITESISELRRNDQIMVLQSRQAAMGEMIHNIAHQWRQPLNSLGLIIQAMRYDYDAGMMTSEQIGNDTEKVMGLICFMSQTIDDFRHFFHEDKKSCCFGVQESIRSAIALVSATLKDHGIALVIEQDADIQINGYPNEYAQALLNLLSNAKDVLLERAVPQPVITVKIRRQGEQAVVTIGDNAGGIPDDVIDRVFDPYFTTKAVGKGSGIGLFMSKTIIEKHMGGSLTVSNVDGGAEFRVEVETVQSGSQHAERHASDAI